MNYHTYKTSFLNYKLKYCKQKNKSTYIHTHGEIDRDRGNTLTFVWCKNKQNKLKNKFAIIIKIIVISIVIYNDVKSWTLRMITYRHTRSSPRIEVLSQPQRAMYTYIFTRFGLPIPSTRARSRRREGIL